MIIMDERIKPKNQSEETRSVRLSSHGWYFKILGTWIDNQLNEELAPFGLSLNQFAIIMTILEQEGLTQSEIGQKVMQPSYAITRNIDNLESLGYVKRKRHEGCRRSYHILLTEAGRALAPDLYRATKSVNELFLSSLEEEQQRELLKTLAEATSKLGLYK
jgi:DNA-binding MarR family transcriptional regulator